MNSAQMILKYKAYLGGRGDDEVDSVILTRLNDAYHYEVAAAVPGFMQEGLVTFTVNPYPGSLVPVRVEDHVVGIRDGATIKRTKDEATDDVTEEERPVIMHTNYESFWRKFPRGGPSEQESNFTYPTDILFFDDGWQWRPWSRGTYTAYVPVSRYPTDIIGPDQTNIDVNEQNHAMAVVLFAALGFAEEKGLDEIQAKVERALVRRVGALKTKSLGGIQTPRRRESF